MDRVISFYKFVTIDDLADLRQILRKQTEQFSLMGTILIAHEGINGSVAGTPENLQSFWHELTQDPRFCDMAFKETLSDDAISYRRMLVKIKKEIITMKCPDLKPTEDTGNYLSPLEFKTWMDEGKDFILVDTRNDYEVSLGTFKGAIDPQIKVFSEFPQWVDENLKGHEEKEIVTFCTGGIRCEKATAFMKKKGFSKVHQIHGGILKYFEDTANTGGEKHWEGDCVVFDKRKAVTFNLTPASCDVCYICLAVLNEDNKFDKLHPAGFLCLSCHDKQLVYKTKKLEKSLKKSEEFRAKRRAFCQEERKRHGGV